MSANCLLALISAVLFLRAPAVESAKFPFTGMFQELSLTATPPGFAAFAKSKELPEPGVIANLIAPGSFVVSKSVPATAWNGSLIETSIFDTRMLKIDPFEIKVLAADGVVKLPSPATATSILVGAEATILVLSALR
ncbi:MAG: hypothetical protein VB027_07070 [Gordonibacter sp.]|nr:hypothetical protein [Gordonibacter sp.]